MCCFGVVLRVKVLVGWVLVCVFVIISGWFMKFFFVMGYVLDDKYFYLRVNLCDVGGLGL